MPAIVVIRAQWGGEGRGKTTDQLGQDVDYIVKFNGGNNAGHTVVVDGEKFAFRLLPAGVLTPGVAPIISNGVAVDLEVLFNEIAEITSRSKDASSLFISTNAHIVLSYSRVLDRTAECFLGARQLSTTDCGIGPTYADKMNHVGIRVQDLFDGSILHQKMRSALGQKNSLFLEVFNRAAIDTDTVADELLSYANRVRSMIVDCSLVLNHTLDQGKTVLFEAGQVTTLDIDHDTYPFVTSSNPITGGTCTGTGVGPTRIDSVVGVIRAYTTHAGEGPFPTELLDDMGERLRTEGGEYGVTIGRPRRCGWHDVVVTRYAVHVDGLTGLAMTKLGTLTGHKTILVCVACNIDGTVTQEMPLTQSGFHHTVLVYRGLPGWDEDINEARSFADLPQAAQDYILRTEELTRCRASIIGIGPGRKVMISRHLLIG